jgi:AraC family transcriptional regulator
VQQITSPKESRDTASRRIELPISLALYAQAVLQGTFILTEVKAARRSRLPAMITCTGILSSYSLNPIQGEFLVTENELPVDKTPSTFLGSPRFEDGRPMLLAGLRGSYTKETMKEIPALWNRFVSLLGKVQGQVSDVTYGVCFPSSNGFDYLSGVEVQSAQGLPEGFTTVMMPVERYAVFAHRGHISKLNETCRAIEREWLPKSRHSFALGAPGAPGFFERYGQDFDPAVGVGDVEVWVPIR